MPTYQIVGKRNVKYKRKSVGQQVNGYELHLTYDDANVEGYAVMPVFISVNRLDFKPEVGDHVHLFYNRWGRVETLQLVG